VSIFLLDTNVISELAREVPDSGVARWSRHTDNQVQYLSSVTVGEVTFGAARLAPGRRRDDMMRWIERELLVRFAGRILPFDLGPAWRWGQIRADRQRSGRPIPAIDAQVAAVALHHGATLVTRNVADFADLGITVLSPWSDE
jgi:toxin FitB